MKHNDCNTNTNKCLFAQESICKTLSHPERSFLRKLFWSLWGSHIERKMKSVLSLMRELPFSFRHSFHFHRNRDLESTKTRLWHCFPILKLLHSSLQCRFILRKRTFLHSVHLTPLPLMCSFWQSTALILTKNNGTGTKRNFQPFFWHINLCVWWSLATSTNLLFQCGFNRWFRDGKNNLHADQQRTAKQVFHWHLFWMNSWEGLFHFSTTWQPLSHVHSIACTNDSLLSPNKQQNEKTKPRGRQRDNFFLRRR